MLEAGEAFPACAEGQKNKNPHAGVPTAARIHIIFRNVVHQLALVPVPVPVLVLVLVEAMILPPPLSVHTVASHSRRAIESHAEEASRGPLAPQSWLQSPWTTTEASLSPASFLLPNPRCFTHIEDPLSSPKPSPDPRSFRQSNRPSRTLFEDHHLRYKNKK